MSRYKIVRPSTIAHVLETVLYATDLPEVRAFYRDVLGLREYSYREDVYVFFRLQSSMLLIFNPHASRHNRQVPPHGALGPGHVCFVVDEECLDDWVAYLIECGIVIETVHAWPNGRRSVYFRDPARNSVELASRGIWGLEE